MPESNEPRKVVMLRIGDVHGITLFLGNGDAGLKKLRELHEVIKTFLDQAATVEEVK